MDALAIQIAIARIDLAIMAAWDTMIRAALPAAVAVGLALAIHKQRGRK